MFPVKFCQYFALDILQKLWEQRESHESERFCDVVLIAGIEKTRITAHSCVLSAASEYFNRMFMASMREGTTKEVEIPSVECDILQLLVQYCYTGLVENIQEDRVVELLKTAEMLLMRNVVTTCANFLAERLHPSNCFGFAILAEQHRCETLLQKAKDYSLEHFMEVRETEEFLNLNAGQLGELLSSDCLNVSSEWEVFKGLKNWIDYNRIEREIYQAEMLKLVRLPLLGKSILKQHIKPICISTGSLQIYIEALEQNLSQQYIQQNERKSVKLRKSKEFLMGITLSASNLYIHYYCPQRRKWMKWSKDLVFRGWPGYAFIEDNLYFVGGQQTDNKSLNTVVCLNLKTMKLTDVSQMKTQRRWCSAAFLNGFLYAVGGDSHGNKLSSVEKWNSNNNTWSKVASMAVVRCGFGLAVLNEKLYAVGGVSSSGKVNSAECYNPHINEWKPIAPMHEARSFFGMTVFNGLLYAVGGKDDVKTVESYNPETNSWTMLCNLNDNLKDLKSCTTFRDKLIVFHANRVQEYDEETNEWKTSAYLKSLRDNHLIFTYSGELLTSGFVGN